MSEPKLTEVERRSLGCQCTRLDDVWRHVRGCPVPNVEAILAARIAAVIEEVADGRILRLAYRYEQERDEARANRDRLAHENAALRRQVAELEAERDHFKARLAVRYAEMDETRDRLEALANKNFARAEKAESEQAYTYGLARKAHERAEAAERALAARDEVIARVRASLVHTDPSQIGSSRSAWLDGEAAMASRVRAALDGPAPQPDEEACQMHCPGSVATPNADGVYEHGCTCPESDEPDCTCTHYVVDHSDPEPYHPENLDREDDPACPIHGTPLTTDAEEAQ